MYNRSYLRTKNSISAPAELNHKSTQLYMHTHTCSRLYLCRLEFEKTVVQTLNDSINQMQAAHTAREADWHELSMRWMQFEKELSGDNERCVCVLAVIRPWPTLLAWLFVLVHPHCNRFLGCATKSGLASTAHASC